MLSLIHISLVSSFGVWYPLSLQNRSYTFSSGISVFAEIISAEIFQMCIRDSYQLDNLVAVVDNNGLQIDGRISDVMSPYPIDEKFKAFGWQDVYKRQMVCLPSICITML